VGAGYNGHARKCECGDCVKRRVNDYLARIEDTSRMVPRQHVPLGAGPGALEEAAQAPQEAAQV
jgi:hypothetical protein